MRKKRSQSRADIIDILSKKLENKMNEKIKEAIHLKGDADDISTGKARNGIYNFAALPLKDIHTGSYAIFGVSSSTTVGL